MRLENARLRIGFEPRNGRLVELVDRRSGQSFTRGTDELWALNLLTDSTAITPANARRFIIEHRNNGLQLVWREFGLVAAPQLRVTVTIRLQGTTPMSEWRIALDSVGSLGVETVRFPRIAGIPPLGASEEIRITEE